jgi:hypothetical protein
MARWAAGGWLLLGMCLLAVGCRESPPPVKPPGPSARGAPPTRPRFFVDLPELYARPAEAAPSPPPPDAPREWVALDEEPPPSRLLLTDSVSWEWPERDTVDGPARDEEETWRHEAAQAARAGNVHLPVSGSLDDVPIASATVDGRVTRVRPGALEVSDDEGNVYELLIDGHSRALRRGHHISLRRLTEGTPVRASFELRGGGDSLAREIEVRR